MYGQYLKPISEIADVVCGPFGSAIKSTDYQEAGIPLIRIVNISKDGYMDYSDIVYITNELGSRLANSQVSQGDIVISQRGTLGQCAVVDEKYPILNISANIIAIKKIRGVSAAFIRNYVLSDVGRKQLERHTSGQVQKKITTSDVAELLIPTSCNETKLNKIMNEGYSHYVVEMQKADELVDGIDKYVMDKLGFQIPEFENRLTCAVRLSDIRVDKTMSCDYYHPERMALIHMMKDADIFDSQCLDVLVEFVRDIVSVNESNQDYLGLAGVMSQTGELSGVSENATGQAFKFKKGDILYARLRPYLNKVLLAESDGICSTEFHVMRIRHKAKILPEYLAAMMRSLIILSQTRHMMTGNTHPRISNDDVKKLIIPIPDIGIQKIISEEITRRKLEARRIKTEAELEWKTVKVQFEKELLGE